MIIPTRYRAVREYIYQFSRTMSYPGPKKCKLLSDSSLTIGWSSRGKPTILVNTVVGT